LIKTVTKLPEVLGWFVLAVVPVVLVWALCGGNIGQDRREWIADFRDKDGNLGGPQRSEVDCNYLTFDGIRTRWLRNAEDPAFCPWFFTE